MLLMDDIYNNYPPLIVYFDVIHHHQAYIFTHRNINYAS